MKKAIKSLVTGKSKADAKKMCVMWTKKEAHYTIEYICDGKPSMYAQLSKFILWFLCCWQGQKNSVTKFQLLKLRGMGDTVPLKRNVALARTSRFARD